MPRLLALFLALDQLCRSGICCTSVFQLCHVIITGTVIGTDNDSEDVACAGRNYVDIMSPVVVGLVHLKCGTMCFSFLIVLCVNLRNMCVLCNVERYTVYGIVMYPF